MKNECDFQVGDGVTCLMYGEGRIKEIDTKNHETYPVNVFFKIGHRERYTLDGKYSTNAPRTLYHGWDLKITVEEKAPVRYPWVNVYDYGRGLEVCFHTYPTREMAKNAIVDELEYRFTIQLKPQEES